MHTGFRFASATADALRVEKDGSRNYTRYKGFIPVYRGAQGAPLERIPPPLHEATHKLSLPGREASSALLSRCNALGTCILSYTRFGRTVLREELILDYQKSLS